MSVYTEFGQLKEVIVGRELLIPERQIDITFKAFYNSLTKSVYKSIDSYKINSDILHERIEDLDNLAKTLTELNVKVQRPEITDKIINIKTPNWQTYLSSVSNVRDLTLIYGDKIIETPPLVRNRYLENLNLYYLYQSYMMNGKQWIKAPNNKLTNESLDINDWRETRDYTNINPIYDMGIDAAQYIKMGKDLLCNISSYNHYLGAKWIQSILTDTKIHYMYNAVDNHLDGAIIPLREGTFLINNNLVNGKIQDYLPEKYKKWDFIEISEPNKKTIDEYNIHLASLEGMNINVLSINENTILVSDSATHVIKTLEQHNFNVIPIQLRHSVLFGGGIHCSTLDVEREDEQYIFN